MNVQLQIGLNYFHLPIADAAKVMAILNDAVAADTYWVDNESGLRTIKPEYMEIKQVSKAPISEAEYQAKRKAYEDKRKAQSTD